MAQAKWKKLQLQVAKLLEASALPLAQGQRASLASQELVAIVRHRTQAPQWLRADMAAAEDRAGFSRYALVVLTTDDQVAYVISALALSAKGAPH